MTMSVSNFMMLSRCQMAIKQEITENVTAIDAGYWAEGAYVWKVLANGKEGEIGKWVKK